MKITNYRLFKIDLPLRNPFVVSFGTITHKRTLILELTADDGTQGYSECSAFDVPFYNEEFREGAYTLLIDQLLPHIVDHEIDHPDDIYQIFNYIRINKMAISAVNCALWDVYAKQAKQPLAEVLGGVRDKVETGVSIGVQSSPAELVKVVGGYIKEGYRRIKMKIKPGKDYEYIKAVRDAYPDAMLMADANSAYRLEDVDMLKKLDELNLIMIEQPLEPGDLIDHATLQAQLKTPICLDESIVSLDDARKMVQLNAGKIINIKVARVGGFGAAKQIQAYAKKHGIQCWCGGMLDSGVARAGNVAIATLDNYTLPNDIAPCQRYYDNDIIKPLIELDGTFVNVSDKPGIGYDIDFENLERFAIEIAEY
ncbi:o-succinylbenzoate synthase [Ligilactobacillus equi]|uniref:o-succinylbenzoate synthase n=1 Tax=Ligilactobacillus equi TaxID=137357 RepID=UPI002ED5AE4A